MINFRREAVLIGWAILIASSGVRADEGMWTFDNLPLRQFRERYGFEPTSEWIMKVRSGSVRFNSGGSGSFISAEGLVLTNHHIAAETLQKISTPAKDYFKEGFLAAAHADEVKAPDLELNALVGIRDVTDLVSAAVATGMDIAAAAKARRQAIARIEKESSDQTGLRSDVVTLYRGGRYHLYTYKKYTDVRLVFAPEHAIASFGGDPDNFEFPRYDLDVAFFRAYDNGRPANPAYHLAWGTGSKEGDLVFVAGHPGSTSRLNIVAHLEFLRDIALPRGLSLIQDREEALIEYGRRGPEALRQAGQDLQSIQNTRKALVGRLAGLRDPALIQRKAQEERSLRDRIGADPRRRETYGPAWDKIARALETARRINEPASFLENGTAFNSQLFEIARTIVRLVEEDSKPNAERLREFGDAGRASLVRSLFSPAPIYPEYEEATLARSFAYWRRTVGEANTTLARVLKGRTPEQTARDLVRGSRLADVAYRKRLVEGKQAAVAASDDSMILLAREIDLEARAIRKIAEDEVDGVLTSQYALIAKALFEDKGTSIYPDATFTLRLAYGQVKGLQMEGKPVAAYTTIGGAFEHARVHGNTAPYNLPPSWFQTRDAGRLNLETPLNLVTTSDTIGGNSGSPVIDRSGAVIGLNFDRNRFGLARDFGYDGRLGRNIAVDVRGITEALRAVYRADGLLRELQNR